MDDKCLVIKQNVRVSRTRRESMKKRLLAFLCALTVFVMNLSIPMTTLAEAGVAPIAVEALETAEASADEAAAPEDEQAGEPSDSEDEAPEPDAAEAISADAEEASDEAEAVVTADESADETPAVEAADEATADDAEDTAAEPVEDEVGEADAPEGEAEPETEVEPEADAEADPEAESEAEEAEEAEEARTEFTYQDSRVLVTAKASKAANLPMSAELKADYLAPGSSAYAEAEAAVRQAYGIPEDEEINIAPYDIYFVADGARIEPEDGKVEVRISFLVPVTADVGGDVQVVDTGVVHITDDGDIEKLRASVAASEDGTIEAASFTSSSFSTFVPYVRMAALMEADGDAAESDDLENFTISVEVAPKDKLYQEWRHL